MHPKRSDGERSPRALLLVPLAVAALLPCCATTTVDLAPSIPISNGQIFAREHGDAVQFRVALDQLPEARLVDPAAETFVVWLKPDESEVYDRIGALQPNGSGRGRLAGTTPHRLFSVVVTAEPRPGVVQPTGPVVMEGHVYQPPAAWRELTGESRGSWRLIRLEG